MEFIYRPQSGDRVLASNPTEEIAVALYENGCRHVGGGIRLDFTACDPGANYWRPQAAQLAKQFVTAFGGIAWDTNGVVSLIVPIRHAWRIFCMMRIARPFPWVTNCVIEDAGNLMRLVCAGAAVVSSVAGESGIGLHSQEAGCWFMPVSYFDDRIDWRIRQTAMIRLWKGGEKVPVKIDGGIMPLSDEDFKSLRELG